MSDEPRRFASETLRGVMGDGPPYDPAKVLAWFDRHAGALLIELEILEADFPRHNPHLDIQKQRQ
jgi:hypothetical protein